MELVGQQSTATIPTVATTVAITITIAITITAGSSVRVGLSSLLTFASGRSDEVRRG